MNWLVRVLLIHQRASSLVHHSRGCLSLSESNSAVTVSNTHLQQCMPALLYVSLNAPGLCKHHSPSNLIGQTSDAWVMAFISISNLIQTVVENFIFFSLLILHIQFFCLCIYIYINFICLEFNYCNVISDLHMIVPPETPFYRHCPFSTFSLRFSSGSRCFHVGFCIQESIYEWDIQIPIIGLVCWLTRMDLIFFPFFSP